MKTALLSKCENSHILPFDLQTSNKIFEGNMRNIPEARNNTFSRLYHYATFSTNTFGCACGSKNLSNYNGFNCYLPIDTAYCK